MFTKTGKKFPEARPLTTLRTAYLIGYAEDKSASLQ